MRRCLAAASILIFTAATFSMTGCAGQNAVQPNPTAEHVWPKAPERERIRYVASVSRPADLRIQQGFWTKFRDFIVGDTGKAIRTPYGVATGPGGALYVVDSFLKSVHVFDVKQNRYYRFPEEPSSLELPIDIAVDAKSGRLFITDAKQRTVKIFGNSGKRLLGEIGRGDLQRPTGCTVNAKTSELLVVDAAASRVFRYDLKNDMLKGSFGGDGAAEGRLHFPTDVYAADDGRILVSDSLNFRIQVFTPDGRFQHRFGGPGDTPGRFGRPKGIAADSAGHIYVVDGLFDHVQIFDSWGTPLMALGKTGSGPGEFWIPAGIHIDEKDRIYVSDVYNKRIQIFQFIKQNGRGIP